MAEQRETRVEVWREPLIPGDPDGWMVRTPGSEAPFWTGDEVGAVNEVLQGIVDLGGEVEWAPLDQPATPEPQEREATEARGDLAARLERHADWIENPTIDMNSSKAMKADLREAASLIDQQARQLEAMRVSDDDRRYIEAWITNLDRSLPQLRPGSLGYEDTVDDRDVLRRILTALDPERNTDG